MFYSHMVKVYELPVFLLKRTARLFAQTILHFVKNKSII